MGIIGVYSVTCSATGKSYIGWSTNVHSRLGWHRSHLRQGKHSRGAMQDDFNEFGEATFTFTVLIECQDEDQALAREAELIGEAFKAGKAYNGVVPVSVREGFKARRERLRREAEVERARLEQERRQRDQQKIALIKRRSIAEFQQDCITLTRMFQDDKGFRRLVELFLEVAQVSAEEFGLKSVADAGFVAKLRAPDAPSVSLATAKRVRDFVEAYVASFEIDPRDSLPVLASSEKLLVMDCRRLRRWLPREQEAAA